MTHTGAATTASSFHAFTPDTQTGRRRVFIMTTIHTQRPTLVYVACFYPDLTAFAGLLLSRHSQHRQRATAPSLVRIKMQRMVGCHRQASVRSALPILHDRARVVIPNENIAGIVCGDQSRHPRDLPSRDGSPGRTVELLHPSDQVGGIHAPGRVDRKTIRPVDE